MPEEVNPSKMISGIASASDIANLVGEIISITGDIAKAQEIVNETQVMISKIPTASVNLLLNSRKSGQSLLLDASANLRINLQTLVQLMQNQHVTSATGMKITSACIGEQLKIFMQNNTMDMQAKILFDIPETYVLEKVKRFYNWTLRPAILSPEMATKLYNEKEMPESEWHEIMAQQGITDKNMNTIADQMSLKPEAANVMRLIQVMDVPDAAMEWILDRSGCTMPQVRQMYKTYWKSLQLRDEFASYVNFLKSAYADGLLTDAQLSAELITHKGSKAEAAQILENCQMELGRDLIRTEIATRTWYYRNDCYVPVEPETAEDNFYDDLATLGINSAVVNTLVRLEAAKKGVVWERS